MADFFISYVKTVFGETKALLYKHDLFDICLCTNIDLC